MSCHIFSVQAGGSHLCLSVFYNNAALLTAPLHKNSSMQSRHDFDTLVLSRDVCSPWEADQATLAFSPKLVMLHPWCQMAKLHIKLCPQESSSAQHRVHLVSGSVVLG